MKNIFLHSLFLLFLASSLSLFAQIRNADFEVHNRGILWETMNDDGTIGAAEPLDQFSFYPSMDWPGGPGTLPLKDEQRSYMAGAGMWMGGIRDGALFFSEHGPFNRVDDANFEGIQKTENFIENVNFNPNQAEETITAIFTTGENIRVERRSHAWSFPGVNNFIIIEYLLTNENSSAISDFYLGLPYLIRPSYQDILAHNGWGDDANRSDEVVAYDTSRSLLFAYDDTPNISFPSDVGNYVERFDELRTTGYAGYALLYADPASDNRPQPANVLVAQLLDHSIRLTLDNNTQEALYAILNGSDRSMQADPEDRIVPFMLMSCGPYDIPANESIRIVVVEAVNGIDLENAQEGISAQGDLPQGKTLLQGSIDNARTLFENDYQLTEIPPRTPDITVLAIPTDQSISISFSPIDEGWTNPINGEENFREYRIYRSNRSFNGPWERIRVLRPSSASHRLNFFNEDEELWAYKDTDIQVGVSYYYTVTSRDTEGVESFWINRLSDPVKAANPPAENTLNIKVFPNPFRRTSGLPLVGEENTITWTNLPPQATIRIYTAGGEMVKTIEHDNENVGEAVWNQLSDAQQRTAPGIYFWTVSSEVGRAKGTLLLIK